MIKKAHGLEICAPMAPSHGATSDLSLSAVFTLFQPVSSISALCLHSILIQNDCDDSKGLRTGILRLYSAFTWRHFRFIVIGFFYPLFASFVDQRTLFTLHNDFNSYSTLKMLSVLRLQIAYILQLKRYMTQYLVFVFSPNLT